MGPLIDRATGAVSLSNDLVLTPGLAPERVASYIQPGELASARKTTWLAPISVATVYGTLDVRLFFRKGALRQAKLRIDSEFGPQQALIKGRHDGFLTELLGRPTSERPAVRTLAGRIFVKALGQNWPMNTKELTWQLRWGAVVSTVELREGLADFCVEWNR
ncbi:MAG: hypothetical protein P4L46_07875 [Fimbriimonas sp.]|nr:hypothetical protein [Fimbriimonas sp.]